MIKLWVDDLRDPEKFLQDKKYLEGVIWAKTYFTAVEFIKSHEEHINVIHLDNDLGEEKEGKHIFNLVETMLNDGKFPNLLEIIVHSSNYPASNNIMSAKDIIWDKYKVKLSRTIYMNSPFGE